MWTRQDLFCDAQWRLFTNDLASNFSTFVILQALLWISLHIYHLAHFIERKKDKDEKKEKEEFEDRKSLREPPDMAKASATSVVPLKYGSNR